MGRGNKFLGAGVTVGPTDAGLVGDGQVVQRLTCAVDGAGAMGQGSQSGGGSRSALMVPTAVAEEGDEPEEPLWDDDDEW